MYSLLIVDDEPLIADNIYDLFIDRPELSLDIYTAYSGPEALKRAEKEKIDILITDITMPGMNGFELQKAVRRIWPDCRVLFLTGYDEFDYVQSAIRCEGADYILKSEDESVVVDALRRTIGVIESERKNRLLLDRAKSSISLAMPLLQSKCLAEAAGGWNGSREELEAQFREFEIPLDARMPVMILMARPDCLRGGVRNSRKNVVLYGIQSAVQKQIRDFARAASFVTDSQILWYVQPREDAAGDGREAWDRCRQVMKGSMDSFQETGRGLYGVPVSYALSNPVPWEDVPLQVEDLGGRLLRESVLSGETLLIDGENGAGAGQPETEAERENKIRPQLNRIPTLKHCLENGMRREFLAYYEEIMGAVGPDAGMDVCAEVYYSISVIFLSCLNRWNITEKVSPHIDLSKLTNMWSFQAWPDVIRYFRTLADVIFDVQKKESFVNANRVFGFIQAYADQHIGGDLSLSRFAELLHYHPFYLSRLFKQVTGESLSTYVSRVKIRKARQMLRGGNEKINEISAALGFETASYFTRFFKKYTGETPQQYRNHAAEAAPRPIHAE